MLGRGCATALAGHGVRSWRRSPFRWHARRRRRLRRRACPCSRSSAIRTARRPRPSRARPPHPIPSRGVPAAPRNPFMAPNPRNNIHDDPYMSDTYRQPGPLGDGPAISTLFSRECGSVTFDSAGRIVTVCVGLDRPVLAVLDPPHPSRRSPPCLCRFGTRRPRAAPSPTSRAAATSTWTSTTGQSCRPTTTTSWSSRSTTRPA